MEQKLIIFFQKIRLEKALLFHGKTKVILEVLPQLTPKKIKLSFKKHPSIIQNQKFTGLSKIRLEKQKFLIEAKV
jgi:hypothetical protein